MTHDPREVLERICQRANETGGADTMALIDTIHAMHGIAREALSASAPKGEPPPAAGWDGSRWRHKKRGSTYIEIGRGKIQSDNWFEPDIAGDRDSKLVDMAEVVVYRSDEDGSIWVRPVTEFEDGRFEAIRRESPPPLGVIAGPISIDPEVLRKDALLDRPDAGGGVREGRPPTPDNDAQMKIAVDWYTWGFQSGMEAKRKMERA